jgi:hypothetical protein
MEFAVMRPIGAQSSDQSGQCFSGEGDRWQQQSFSSARRMIDTVAVTRGRVSLSPCTALWSIKIKNNIFGTQ